MTRPLYSFLPIEGNPDLNEALREIDDSLRALREEIQLVSAFGIQPFVAKQGYAKFGFNPDIDTGTPEDIWSAGGTLTWPSSAAAASVVSDNAADAAAGTGAQEVVLVGVDSSLNEVTEVVTTNGTTPVNSTTSFLFVNSAYGRAVGSGGVNAGTIDVSIGGNLVKQIPPNTGQCLCSHFVCPNPRFAGEVPYLTAFDATLGKNSNSWGQIEILSQIPGETLRVRSSIIATGGAAVDYKIESPIRLEPGERAWVRAADVSANNEAIGAGITILYLNAPTNA